MRAPTAISMSAELGVSREEGLAIRTLTRLVDLPDLLQTYVEDHCPDTWRYVRSLHSSPWRSSMWRRSVVMHAIDRILGTHGVEPLGPIAMSSGPPFEYCNAGDTYAVTLVFDRDRDKLIISSWGDIAERDPRLRSNRYE